MKRFTFHVAALGFCSLIGCSDAGIENIERAREAIVNGKLSSSNDDAVVQILGGGSGCTGTLIAPTVVLTALHCVTDFDSRFTFKCRPDGTLAPGATTGQLGEPVDPTTVTVGIGVSLGDERIPAKAIYGTGATNVCHDDLAVIVLDRAPDIGDAPLVSLRFARSTRKGELARAVGYGDVEQTDTTRGRQVRTNITVRGIGGPDASTPGDVGVLPRTVQVGEGPCHGDSGGPLFSQETGAEIGVYSILNANTCTGDDVRNTYTLIAPFESLIREALESEGQEPILEPEEPTGAGGEAGAASVPVGGGSGGTSGDPMGEPPADPDDGSGSYRSSGCALRALGGRERAPLVLLSSALLGAVWLAARRRARSASDLRP
jgi:hypothetical protein